MSEVSPPSLWVWEEWRNINILRFSALKPLNCLRVQPVTLTFWPLTSLISFLFIDFQLLDNLLTAIILLQTPLLAALWTSLSLSPRRRLYYLLLYYTTPTFTPALSEWEVIANANEGCVGLLWATVWVGRSESAAARLRTCARGSARVCQPLSMCVARPQADIWEEDLLI